MLFEQAVWHILLYVIQIMKKHEKTHGYMNEGRAMLLPRIKMFNTIMLSADPTETQRLFCG